MIPRNVMYLLGALMIFVSACSKDDDTQPDRSDSDPSLGWTGEDDTSKIPSNLNFGTNGSYPESFDLSEYFPPIGDQGQYGTCVAWAAGYNAKSAVEAIELDKSASDLSQSQHQISPSDLFTAIPNDLKGSGCNGTNFTSALDVLQSRGAASLDVAPYGNQLECSQSNLPNNWTSDAQNHTIEYYRKIDVSIEAIKKELYKKQPVVCGAKLSDNFMTWNSSAVITSGTGFDNVGQHAYHAMVICGWDDNKGPSGALRIINSWSDQWADNGYVWVDYNYFIQEFSFGGNLFVMRNGQSNTEPNENPTSQGVDLAPWVFQDVSIYNQTGNPTDRLIEFNIYNIGNEPALAADNWSVYYIYYNAFDANDYGVLFYDEFNTSVQKNSFNCPEPNHCIINVDIPPGSNFGQVGWGTESLQRSYNVPQSLTGYYYLVVLADANDGYRESDENNNLFYTTQQYPKYFEFGFSESGEPGPFHPAYSFSIKNQEDVDHSSEHSSRYANHSRNQNAYTPQEILNFIRSEKKSGRLNDHLVNSTNDTKPYNK